MSKAVHSCGSVITPVLAALVAVEAGACGGFGTCCPASGSRLPGAIDDEVDGAASGSSGLGARGGRFVVLSSLARFLGALGCGAC